MFHNPFSYNSTNQVMTASIELIDSVLATFLLINSKKVHLPKHILIEKSLTMNNHE
jgi:hypothetical protein